MIFIHNDIVVQSIDNMLKFYVDGLGMEIVEDSVVSGDIVRYMSKGEADTYRIVLLEKNKFGAKIELIQYINNNEMELGINGNMTFLVPKIDSLVEVLSEKGIFPDSPIYSIELLRTGKYRVVFYLDPEGNKLEFLELGVR